MITNFWKYLLVICVFIVLLIGIGIGILYNYNRLNINRNDLFVLSKKSTQFNNLDINNVKFKLGTTKKKWKDIDVLSKKYLIPYPFLQLLINETLLWNKKDMDHQIQLENLKLLKIFLEKHKIKYYLDCGTLLGAVRDKNFIKGDTDIDIQVPQKYLERFRENIKELEDNGFIIWRNEDNGFMGLSMLRKGEYIDIYRHFIDMPFPLISYEFLGMNFPVPENYDEYLTELYGNWKVPKKGEKGPGNWQKGMPNYTKKYSIDLITKPVGNPKNGNNFLFILSNLIRGGKYDLNNIIPMPIYYINLDRSPERRIFMEDQFRLLNVSSQTTRISAVDGKKLPNSKIGKFIVDNLGEITYTNNYSMPSIGELGCTLSHIVAIKEAYNKGNQLALILEDDVSILPMVLQSQNKLLEILASAPPNWCIISLICYIDCKKKCNVSMVKDLCPYNEKNNCYSTGAYIINRKGMKNILSGMKPLEIILDKNDSKNNNRIVADLFIYKRSGKCHFYCGNILSIPGLFDTTIITNDNFDYSKYYKLVLDTYTFPNLDGSLNIYDSKTYLPIPKIIHQTWKTHILPDNFKLWSDECKNIHKNYQYNLWSDDDNRNFISKEYPNFLPIYDSYDVNIKKVDAVRYFYLYHFGGVYMDLDFLCLKNLDKILEDGKAIFGYQLNDINRNRSIANAFMAAPPKHPLFKILIDNLLFTKDNHVLDATGPGYLTNIIKLYKKDDIVVHKMPIIYTHEWDKKDNRLKECQVNVNKCRQIFPNSYTSTIWTGSWL